MYRGEAGTPALTEQKQERHAGHAHACMHTYFRSYVGIWHMDFDVEVQRLIHWEKHWVTTVDDRNPALPQGP